MINVIAGSSTKLYDGTPLTNDAATVSGVPEGFTYEVTTSGSATNVADEGVNNIESIIIRDSANNDVTKYFTGITKTPGKLTVISRPITITAASLSGTFTGNPLTASSAMITDGTLAGGQYLDHIDVTGSQTEVGSSPNIASNAVIKDGEANVTENYSIEYVAGILNVTAGPVIPTPIPPVPPTPTPTTTPTVTPTATTPTPAPQGLVTADQDQAPAAAADEQTLTKDSAAKAAGHSWALVNLICAILTVIMIVILAFSKKKRNEFEQLEDNQNDDAEKKMRNKFKVGMIGQILTAIVSVVAFILTENVKNPMVLTDKWTLLMVILAVVSLVVYVAIGKRKDEEDDETVLQA